MKKWKKRTIKIKLKNKKFQEWIESIRLVSESFFLFSPFNPFSCSQWGIKIHKRKVFHKWKKHNQNNTFIIQWTSQ